MRHFAATRRRRDLRRRSSARRARCCERMARPTSSTASCSTPRCRSTGACTTSSSSRWATGSSISAHQQNFDKIKMIRLHGRSPRYLPLAMEEHLRGDRGAAQARSRRAPPPRSRAISRPPSAARSGCDARRPATSLHAKITIAGLALDYVNPETGAGHRAVEGLDLDVAANEFLCVLGPSGCGKSTLLAAIAGFLRPTAGSIVMDGKPVDRPERRARRRVPGIRAAAVDERARQRGARPQAPRHRPAAERYATARQASSRSPTCTASSTSTRTSSPAA